MTEKIKKRENIDRILKRVREERLRRLQESEKSVIERISCAGL